MKRFSPLQQLYSEWADATDNKVVATFGIGSAILGQVPTLHRPEASGLPLITWLLAGSCWIAAVIFCYLAYRPIHLRIGPDPIRLLSHDWLKLSPKQFRYYRLHHMGKSYEFNRDQLDKKAHHLGLALWCTAGEVGLLAAALLLSSA